MVAVSCHAVLTYLLHCWPLAERLFTIARLRADRGSLSCAFVQLQTELRRALLDLGKQ